MPTPDRGRDQAGAEAPTTSCEESFAQRLAWIFTGVGSGWSSRYSATIKENRRAGRFKRRGPGAVRSEWRLLTATHNLLKLHRHQLGLQPS